MMSIRKKMIATFNGEEFIIREFDLTKQTARIEKPFLRADGEIDFDFPEIKLREIERIEYK